MYKMPNQETSPMPSSVILRVCRKAQAATQKAEAGAEFCSSMSLMLHSCLTQPKVWQLNALFASCSSACFMTCQFMVCIAAVHASLQAYYLVGLA